MRDSENSQKSPPAKKQRTIVNNDDDYINALLSDSDSDEEATPVDSIEEEFNLYMRMVVPWPKKEPGKEKEKPNRLKWWKTKQDTFPIISKLARRYLAVPASSVPSERVFSVAGTIVNKKRSRLTPSHVATLIFLNKNWK